MTGPRAQDGTAHGNVWLGPLVVALWATAYGVACALALPLHIDEHFTRNLALDESLGAMYSALRDGADGSFPLHPTLAWLWMRLMPDTDLSLRATSSAFVVGMSAYMVFRLQRHCPWPIAAAAVLVVLVDDRATLYLQTGRFYGLLVFAFAWLFWSTLDLSRSRVPTRWTRSAVALASATTALSHPLGVLYVAVPALAYLVMARRNGTLRWRNAALFLVAPALFVLWMALSPGQREINMVYAHRDTFGWGYILWNYVVQASLPFTAALCVSAFVLGRATIPRPAQPDDRTHPVTPGSMTLMAYAFATALSVSALVLALDALNIVPVLMSMAVRYAIASVVAQIVLVALVLDGVRRACALSAPARLARRSTVVVAGTAALFASIAGAEALGDQSKRRADIERLLAELIDLARRQQLDIVFNIRQDVPPGAFFLVMRAPTQPVQFVLRDDDPFHELHLRASRNYPNPTPLSIGEFERKPGPYVLVGDGVGIVVVPPRATPRAALTARLGPAAIKPEERAPPAQPAGRDPRN